MGLTIRVKQPLTKDFSASQITLVIGLLFGIVLIGYSRVNPSNTDWIFDGDRLGNQIVWNYFRRSEYVQWPLNLISNYGNGWSNYGHGSNIFISLPLKYLSFFIPNNFQFLGLWICVCCALQGYFAAKLMGLFSTQRLEIVLLSLNFLVFPIFLMRIGLMGHPQLGAQWLLLCGIYLVMTNTVRSSSWVLLLAISFMIDLYIVAMLIVFFIFSQMFEMRKENIDERIKRRFKPFFLVSTVCILMLLVQGYFSLPSGVSGSGFFRISATTYLNPRISELTSFSFFANAVKPSNSTYVYRENAESFLYLGSGFLLFIAILSFLRFTKEEQKYTRLFIPPTIAGIAMFFVGLSNQISILGSEFHYWWPSQLLEIRQIFRSATRFGWPLAYLIALFVCLRVLVSEHLKRFRRLLAVVLLVVNLVDLNPLLRESYRDFRREDLNAVQFRTELTQIFSRYSTINIYPAFDLQIDDAGVFDSESVWRNTKLWQAVLFSASELNLRSNFAYVSRPVGEVIASENQKSEYILSQGLLQKGDLYVFISKSDLEKFMSNVPDGAEIFSAGQLEFIGLPN
jgi:hypothetical protein